MITEAKDVLHSFLSESYRQDLELKSKSADQKRLQFPSLPLLPKDSYLPLCDFQSNSLSNGEKVYRYQGRKAVQLSSVYPADDSSALTGENLRNWPNKIADGDKIQAVTDEIITSLNHKTSK